MTKASLFLLLALCGLARALPAHEKVRVRANGCPFFASLRPPALPRVLSPHNPRARWQAFQDLVAQHEALMSDSIADASNSEQVPFCARIAPQQAPLTAERFACPLPNLPHPLVVWCCTRMQDEEPVDELLLADYNDARPYSNRSADFDQDEASVPSSAVFAGRRTFLRCPSFLRSPAFPRGASCCVPHPSMQAMLEAENMMMYLLNDAMKNSTRGQMASHNPSSDQKLLSAVSWGWNGYWHYFSFDTGNIGFSWSTGKCGGNTKLSVQGRISGM